jgi:hypothetical protein
MAAQGATSFECVHVGKRVVSVFRARLKMKIYKQINTKQQKNRRVEIQQKSMTRKNTGKAGTHTDG